MTPSDTLKSEREIARAKQAKVNRRRVRRENAFVGTAIAGTFLIILVYVLAVIAFWVGLGLLVWKLVLS